jgi:uncharacterized protein
MVATVNCPTCAAPVIWGPDAKFRPFCSERCRLIDLGAWGSEKYAIPAGGPSDGLELNDGLEGSGDSGSAGDGGAGD